MPDLAREPSMEDILASIKRIIAEDSPASTSPRLRRGPVEAVSNASPPAPDEVLELTEPVLAPEPGEAEPSPELSAEPAPEPVSAEDVHAARPPAATLVSPQVANASRDSLAALSALVVRPEPVADNTLEGLVRELLRPMLKDWLDARLPELVESLVAREIARITGRGL